jgi:hypothetical protein
MQENVTSRKIALWAEPMAVISTEPSARADCAKTQMAKAMPIPHILTPIQAIAALYENLK